MFRLFVERPMSASDAAPWATPDELASAAAFPPARQAEWLSWRAIVRREVCREFGCRPAEIAIAYNETGAPVVEGAAVHAAVSHCRGSVAVGLSDAPCAVDIESLDRNFGRIASRYMTPRSRRSLTTRGGLPWCGAPRRPFINMPGAKSSICSATCVWSRPISRLAGLSAGFAAAKCCYWAFCSSRAASSSFCRSHGKPSAPFACSFRSGCRCGASQC